MNSSNTSHIFNKDKHIFISYSRDDNEQPLGDVQGWVTAFHTTLQAYAKKGRFRGEKLRVWRDETDLAGNELLEETIIARIQGVTVLVCVLSENYLCSDYCQMEISLFHQNAGERIAVGGKARIFKVLIEEVPLEEQIPEFFRKLIGYEFYEFEPGTRTAKMFRPEYGNFYKEKYFQKVDDLAQDIRKMLKALENEFQPDIRRGQCVYLAQPASDMVLDYANIRRELFQQGYTVLPDPPLAKDHSARWVIQQYLERCTLSIHLIGSSYKAVPDLKMSMEELQTTLAIEHRKAHQVTFTYLIWTSPKIQVQDPDQQRFIQSLQDVPDLLETGPNAPDLVKAELEIFKDQIRDRLKALFLSQTA